MRFVTSKVTVQIEEGSCDRKKGVEFERFKNYIPLIKESTLCINKEFEYI